MTTISPNKRRILGSLNPNLNASASCPESGSKSEFVGGQLEQEVELQATESFVLPSAGSCERDRGDQDQEPARKTVCLERHRRGAQHQHQQIEAGYIRQSKRRNQSRSASPSTERESTVLFNSKSTTNNIVSQSTTTATATVMEHERRQFQSVLPALHPTRVASEGAQGAAAAFSAAPMATNQIAYPAGLVGGGNGGVGGVGGTFNNSTRSHKQQQPKRTNTNQNPRFRLANQAARQKAEILRLRLRLAAYKIQTGQTDVPLEQLEVVRSSLPWFHNQRAAGGVNGYHDRTTDYNSASWSFISNSSNSSQSQGQGYVQRVNHLRHAAGAAIKAVQAKQERRTAWGRERERERERERYREWYEQFRHHQHHDHHHQASAWEDVTAEQGHDEFSKDQRQQRQHRTVGSENGRKPLPDWGTRMDSWGGSASTGGTAAAAVPTGTMMTTAAAVVTSSPHFSRVDLAERALQAHQRLHSRAVTEDVLMEHEHEHDEIEEEDENGMQVAHQHQHQQYQQHLTTNHAYNGWVVVHLTTENIQEGVPDDIGIGEGEGEGEGGEGRGLDLNLDDNGQEEEEELISRRVVGFGSGSGYSTEPEPEPHQPELPSLPSYEVDVDVGLQDQEGSGGEEEEEEAEGGEEEEQHGDGDEAASGLLSLSRG